MVDQSNSSERPEPGQIVDPMSRLFRPEALDVGSPALVQHFAYRIHDDYAARPDEWPESIQKLLNSLDNRLTRSSPGIKDHIADYKPKPVRIDEDENRRYRTALIDFSWHSIRVTMSFEIFPEHLAVTTVMDLAEWKADLTDTVAPTLNQNIVDLDRLLRARNAQIKGRHSPIEQRVDWDTLESKLHEDLFTKVWDDFCVDILNPPLANPDVKLGGRFTAGRGLVASLAGDVTDKDAGLEHFILLPGHGIKTDLDKPNRLFRRIGVERDDISSANTVLPFMQAATGMKEVAHSVSNLEGNCLYITALGGQPQPQQSKPKNDPIATFFFLATHPEPRQLGYLVDRICTLATVRRAGLFDYLQLTKASKALRGLESTLEEIGERLAAKPAAGGEAAALQSIQGELSAAYAKLNKAAAGEGENKIPRGLLYRVDRSDTYLRYFDRLAGDLQIEPVGSFRSYLELARRRIGDTYGAIASIGVRYETLTKKIDGFGRQLEARELATQVNVIADLQKHMEKQTEVSTKYQRDMRSFLELGEILAFFVFIPAALSDATWKYLGDETWDHMNGLSKIGVFGGSFVVSMGLLDVMRTIKPREGEPDSYLRQGWKNAKTVATEKVILKLRGCVKTDFGRCAKDVIINRTPQDRQRQWRTTKVIVKQRMPLKLRVRMKRAHEIRRKRLSEGPYFG